MGGTPYCIYTYMYSMKLHIYIWVYPCTHIRILNIYVHVDLHHILIYTSYIQICIYMYVCADAIVNKFLFTSYIQICIYMYVCADAIVNKFLFIISGSFMNSKYPDAIYSNNSLLAFVYFSTPMIYSTCVMFHLSFSVL